jgi:membrane protease YdiL (CAAX protease family)
MATAGALSRPIISTDRARDVARGHPLPAFFVLAFGLSWIYELLAFGLLRLQEMPWGIPGVFGPALAAVLVTRAIDGPAGVRALWRRITLWRVGARWYAVALVGVPAWITLSFLFLPDGTGRFPSPAFLVAPLFPVVVVALFFLGGGQEEPGWRGFALPRMQARFGPLAGAILLGLLWGLWHLPLFVWIPDYDHAGSGFVDVATSFVVFTTGFTVGLSLILAWVFNHTRGSVFMAMLLHASVNTALGLAPTTRLATMTVFLAIGVLGLVIVAATRGELGYRQRPGASETREPAPEAEQRSPTSAIGGARTEFHRRGEHG